MSNRLNGVDSLRGFSLLGIFLVNMLIFQYGFHGKDFININDLNFLDKASYFFIQILFDSSFMPIFAILFGFSIIKMKESFIRKKLDSNKMLIKRSFVLFFVGLIHIVFIWEGDILFYYGLTSFLLIFFVNVPIKRLYFYASLLLSITVLLFFIPKETLTPTDYISQLNTIFSQGSYFDILRTRFLLEPPASENSFLVVLINTFYSGSFFLIGMIFAKTDRFKISKIVSLKYSVYLFAAGLILKIIGVIILFNYADLSIHLVGGFILSLGIIFLFLNIYYEKPQLKIFTMLESAGKLSLSNYLLHSIIMILIYYGFGFGYFSQLGLFEGILISTIVFIVQLAGSFLYLKKWNSGPIEYLFRKILYCNTINYNKKRS